MRGVEEECEPRAYTVSVDLQPAAVAGGRAPLDSSRGVESRERRPAVLCVPLMAGIDPYTISAGGAATCSVCSCATTKRSRFGLLAIVAVSS